MSTCYLTISTGVTGFEIAVESVKLTRLLARASVHYGAGDTSPKVWADENANNFVFSENEIMIWASTAK